MNGKNTKDVTGRRNSKRYTLTMFHIHILKRAYPTEKKQKRKGGRPHYSMLAFPFQRHLFFHDHTVRMCAPVSVNVLHSLLIHGKCDINVQECPCLKSVGNTNALHVHRVNKMHWRVGQKKEKNKTANQWQIRFSSWWACVRKDGRWTKRRGSPPRGQGQGRSFVLCVLIGGTWDRL